jgi:hypothetical protein
MKARALLNDNIVGDLIKGWIAKSQLSVLDALKKDPGLPERVMDELVSALESLARLEDAAFEGAVAANVKVPKLGRPRLLTWDCVQGLARVYRTHTGLKPGRGRGPFAKFVSDFIKATHQSHFKFSSLGVISAIQNAHSESKKVIGKSRFDD